MFLKLSTKAGGRLLRYLRLDYFGKKNFKPVSEIEPVLINEQRVFHIGYFVGKQREGSKVYLTMKDLEHLTELVTGAYEKFKARTKVPALDETSESVV